MGQGAFGLLKAAQDVSGLSSVGLNLPRFPAMVELMLTSEPESDEASPDSRGFEIKNAKCPLEADRNDSALAWTPCVAEISSQSDEAHPPLSHLKHQPPAAP